MKRIEDERIINEKRHINSSAFGITFLALWAIVVFRQFVLQQNINEYLDIFLLTIGVSIYVTLNSVFKGVYLTYRSKKARKKVNLIGAIVGTVVFSLIQVLVMDNQLTTGGDILKLLFSAGVFFVVWIISQSILLKISADKANEDL